MYVFGLSNMQLELIISGIFVRQNLLFLHNYHLRVHLGNPFFDTLTFLKVIYVKSTI